MSFYMTIYTREIMKIKWDNKDKVEQKVSLYMEILTKETLML
jgi:hypothetical protein